MVFGVLFQLPLFLFSLTPEAGIPKAEAAELTRFSSKPFENTWSNTDQPVIAGRAQRSWYWGPDPLAGGFYEPYSGTPYGRRLVQYFDKARMEINDPSSGAVTNGLLVAEMVTGKVQQGDNSFLSLEGARVPIAGDINNFSPTYSQLSRIYNISANSSLGESVTRFWNFWGPTTLSFNQYSGMAGTKVADIENGLGIPSAFWDFMNRRGLVYRNGQFINDLVSNWRFSVGLPITEAYWSKVRVGGVLKDVLFQAFERRVLTYTPENEEAFRVEMGNVGQHYVQWRYNGTIPQFQTPILSLFEQTNQPVWYETSEVLNIRTAPSSQDPLVKNTKEHPFVVQLQPGDHVLGIRMVKGEEVEPGSDQWAQIYESPDLFVYAKYLKPFTVPAFPQPPETHKGVWVSVNLASQMMAVFNNGTPIYTTLVATGKPKHETIRGTFSLQGGYRPLSQTMEGGNRAIDTPDPYYKLEDIRYVTYFVTDFAIHGSYWHAKFGIAPQSHGCVNSTLWDASLIHQLPAGTPVEVF